MKWLKKGLLILLSLSIFSCVAGCTNQSSEISTPTKDPMTEAYKNDPAGFVEFHRSLEPRFLYVPISELLEYETQFPDCNGTWFRNQLSGEDLIIYNSYLYALENRFISFILYVEDSDKDFSHIRELVSLDSPFLEQNHTDYERIWKIPINYIGERIGVSMEQFTDSRWEMKMEALEKCRQIVQNIPTKYQTKQAKMEYLYDYVCDNVEYVNYENMADESYFYDAVCKGQTLCDGYSNMLSLLFRMIGVECCEIMGYGEEVQSGHTWVAAKLNEKFYNFDPTFEDTNKIQSDRRIFFGFSDSLININKPEHEEMCPKSTDTSRDFIYADITVNSLTGWGDVKKITEVAEKRLSTGAKTTLIGVRNPVDPKQYDLFFDRFFAYATKTKEISLYGCPMKNCSIIEITLTPR